MNESPSDMICQLKRLACELGFNDEVDVRIDWKIDLIETGYYGYHSTWIFCMIKYVVKFNPNIDIFWNLRDNIHNKNNHNPDSHWACQFFILLARLFVSQVLGLRLMEER